ncbi:MAG: citryl-CoA lyase [Nanoarchaeota archaeon]|nr:citryl-CoA lyase [Nanoarchaeota archaeon]
MEWKTEIAKSSKEETLIRGYNILEMIDKLTFTEAIYLVLKGVLPTKKETRMLDSIFVSSIEHGINPPSTMVARIIASCGTDFNDSLAAGLLAIGKNHGGAVEQSARILQEDINKPSSEIVREARVQKKKISGYGHRIYAIDPRAQKILSIAKELGFYGKYVKKALEIEAELEKQTGKKIYLNIDGAVATVISEMGFDWRVAQAFFIIPRIVGLSAHVHEELLQNNSYRRLDEEETLYLGKSNKKL